MRKDRFKLGQWLKGRIYERRCDLSPDGKYLIYFAMNGRWHSPSKGSWTAISIAPYLKAIVFLPKGDCWNGGGLWTDKNTYWLNDGHAPHLAESKGADGQGRVRCTSSIEKEFYGGECPGIYYDRLVRSGWTYAGQIGADEIKNRKWWNTHTRELFTKAAAEGWILEKIAHSQVGSQPGKGCYWDEHRLTHRTSGKALEFPDWEWAEVDGRSIVWAAEGKIFRGWLGKDGIRDSKKLIDLNGLEFEAVAAPY